VSVPALPRTNQEEQSQKAWLKRAAQKLLYNEELIGFVPAERLCADTRPEGENLARRREGRRVGVTAYRRIGVTMSLVMHIFDKPRASCRTILSRTRRRLGEDAVTAVRPNADTSPFA